MAHTITFPNKDGEDFSGLTVCRDWLTQNGFSHGHMQRESPIGVLHGDYQIAKWRNMNHRERLLLDGMIEPLAGGWRGPHGGAFLTLRDAVVPKGAPQADDAANATLH